MYLPGRFGVRIEDLVTVTAEGGQRFNDTPHELQIVAANGTQIAAAEADTTGTTSLGKRVIDHSFQLPLQVAWIVTALVGILIVWLFFGDQTPMPPTP